MSRVSPESTPGAVTVQSRSACHLLRISLELRDIIYGMLLTTPYCTEVLITPYYMYTEVPTKCTSLRFRLHTAILSVNKQISAEALRVLYQENEFIVLTETAIFVDWQLAEIPKFKLLSENQIQSPLLQIGIANFERSEHTTRTLITTPEGLESIITFLWYQQVLTTNRGHGQFNVSLILKFNLKAVSRYWILSELVLRPWEKVVVEDLVITGDINKPMREHLEKSILEGPFPDDVAAHLMEYVSLAEQEFERKNYNSARRYWTTLQEYWAYVFGMRLYGLGGRRTCDHSDGIQDVLRQSQTMRSEGLLKHVKALLHELRYEEVVAYAGKSQGIPGSYEGSYLWQSGPRMALITKAKLELSTALAQTALGKIEAFEIREPLKWAAKYLQQRGSWSLYKDISGMSREDLTEELTLTVNNELIRLKSPWRCGHRRPLSLTQQSGPLWEVSVVRRSFWELMDLPPEELELR
jgi:hypothetical protein